MPAPPPVQEGSLEEFDEIARLFRPLTFGAPEALGLTDDAAAVPIGDGALIVTTDTLVEGVHTPLGEAPGLIARKLLRTNLSDVAAKAAHPYGWFLNIAWPPSYGCAEREAFAAGLMQEARAFDLKLFGGDTVRTPGPLTATATLLAKAPGNAFVPRSSAEPGDVLLVSGTIGDAAIGVRAALGEALFGLSHTQAAWLLDRYRLPQPRLQLRGALLAHAAACADVSDGLLADAGHIGSASSVGVQIDLDHVPLSQAAAAWVRGQPDESTARLALATGGDDYELVCACRSDRVGRFQAAAASVGIPVTVIGRVTEGVGVTALWRGRPLPVENLGYVHR